MVVWSGDEFKTSFLRWSGGFCIKRKGEEEQLSRERYILKIVMKRKGERVIQSLVM